MAKITYGICVGLNYDGPNLYHLIESIYNQKMTADDEFEIIMIGDFSESFKSSYSEKEIRFLDFDETVKPGWITRKKNLLNSHAKYGNVVLMHDYYMLDRNWLANFNSFDNSYPDWDAMMNRIETAERTRHSDWVIDPQYITHASERIPELSEILMKAAPHENGPQFVSGLDYSTKDLTKLQYISGGFIILKRHVLRSIPMNEEYVWGQGEDLEWSRRLMTGIYKPPLRYRFNIDSVCRVQKPNKWSVTEMPDEAIQLLRDFYG